jgi:hypothetical protein
MYDTNAPPVATVEFAKVVTVEKENFPFPMYHCRVGWWKTKSYPTPQEAIVNANRIAIENYGSEVILLNPENGQPIPPKIENQSWIVR